MSAHNAAVAALLAPSSADYAAQLPLVRKGLVDALSALEADPTPSRAGIAALQMSGAQMFLSRYRQQLLCDGDGDGDGQ